MNTGLDPEVLIQDNDWLVPASILFPPPRRRRGRLNHISYDNAALELRPDHSPIPIILVGRLRKLIKSAFRSLGIGMHKGLVKRSIRLSIRPAMLLRSLDKRRPEIGTFGCSPSLTLTRDFEQRHTRPSCDAGATPWRSAGFHIHNELPFPTAQAVVGVLDGLLGLADVVVNNRLDYLSLAEKRRSVLGYGRAGEHRIRKSPSGVTILEYRTLSPWPISTPETAMSVIQTTRHVCSLPPKTIMGLLDAFPDRKDIMNAINTSNPVSAKDLAEECIDAHLRLAGSEPHTAVSGNLTLDVASTGWHHAWV